MMDYANPNLFIPTLKIVRWFVSGRYDLIASSDLSGASSPEHVRRAVEWYPGTICMPPEDAVARLEGWEVEHPGGDKAYFVHFRLETLEEGESDLEVRFTTTGYIDTPDDMTFEFEDVLVA